MHSPCILQRLFVLLLGLTAALAAAATSAGPDEILLRDGSRILGKVAGSRDGVLTVETEFAGSLQIALDKVDAVRTSEPVVVLLEDDSVLRDQPLLIEDERLLPGSEGSAAYSLAELSVVNPEPWEMGQGYKWSGLANLAWSLERGNTDTDELDYKLDSVWRSTRDRYTFKLNGEIDKTNGDKNADNWQSQGKYDYFLTGPNYVGVLLRAEEDKFADLNLRYSIGPYYGRQIFDTPEIALSAELGVSYVDEDFEVAEDQDYPAANWQINASSHILGAGTRLYFDQLGIWNLDETSDVIVNSTFGLAIPLLWNLEAAAEVLLEYDSGAVEDVDDLDEKYSFRIGYTW